MPMDELLSARPAIHANLNRKACSRYPGREMDNMQ